MKFTMVKYVSYMLKSRLFEMAKFRNTLRDEIARIVYKVTEHLLYLKLYPESRDVEHWTREIIGFLYGISNDSVKPKNKKPDVKFYFDVFYNECYANDRFQKLFSKAFYNDIIQDEGKSMFKLKDINVPELDKDLQTFYMNLSKLCSENDIIVKDDIRKLIKIWYDKGL